MLRRQFWPALLGLIATLWARLRPAVAGTPATMMDDVADRSVGPTTMKVLRVRRYRAGYEVRTERHDGTVWGCDPFEVRSAYTPNGDYMGDPKTAFYLCRKRGIIPERRETHSSICSIGFSHKDGKWYGWSHRAIYGFKPGDVVEEGSCCAEDGWTEEYLAEHPEERRSLPVGFKAKDWADARRMAVAFAASVS